MNSVKHLLVVDDDPEICELLARYLEKNEYRVSTAESGRAMMRIMDHHHIDLIVLDVILAGEDGLEITRDLRARSDIPIILMSARGEAIDRIVGLEMGADDYLPKPFNSHELLARIEAVMRRSRSSPPAGTSWRARKYRFAGWTLNVGGRDLISVNGVNVSLTSGEFDLLVAFAEHPQTVLGRGELSELTHGRKATPFDRGVDVQIGRLRRRIEANPKKPKLIKTVRGGGYVFAVSVEVE